MFGAAAGSGLGLAVSRRLVEAAGGTLVVTTSDELGGALLRVELPSASPPSSP